MKTQICSLLESAARESSTSRYVLGDQPEAYKLYALSELGSAFDVNVLDEDVPSSLGVDSTFEYSLEKSRYVSPDRLAWQESAFGSFANDYFEKYPLDPSSKIRLELLATDRAAQGRGYGSALLRCLEERADQDSQSIAVICDHEVASKLYQKNGFHEYHSENIQVGEETKLFQALCRRSMESSAQT
ncbi:uncharacterized protein I303_102205 [Kwoniella dejecticola CBS 10117]|uniref:N-acetyltransferase domain-containing protein n=1 Tax=Kwoniella dejecticola CBS 10117 TaxID=1296121 RepID=A0A1A6ABL5_9TREE|nr:uncharacterized protein I303_01654 [Kwoniella dejecticola CBS 10117]OBR87449.1 hypothetical protein I303_01654 [Kwoniella dejecticola CBS 10117]